MINTIKWLWAVYQMRKVYFDKRLLFSGRQDLIDSARPQNPSCPIGSVMAYPDAFFMIEPEDARRMVDNFEVMQRNKMSGLKD